VIDFITAAMNAASSTACTRSYRFRRIIPRQEPNIATSQTSFFTEKPGRMFLIPGIRGIRKIRQLGMSTSTPSWYVRTSTWWPRPLRNSSTVLTAIGVPRAW
jgi:hypothetical protein